MEKKRITIELETSSQKGSNKLSRDIVNIFGLSEEGWKEKLSDIWMPMSGIVLITGPSGIGKTLLLNEIEKLFPYFKKVPDMVGQNEIVSDILGFKEAGETIRYLSKFGLGEPRIMIGPYSHLSEGQKERFLISLAILQGKGPLILDEFTTRLDRQTANVVAVNLGKILRKEKINAFIASCHDDILDFLQPDYHIHLCFNGGHSISKKAEESTQKNYLRKLDIEISLGTLEDYKQLAHYHYENDDSEDIRVLEPMIDHIITARCQNQVIGVNLCTRPWPKALEKLSQFSEINKYILQSFRLIVHPQYRGIGLTKTLDVIPKKQTRKILAVSAFTSFYSFPTLAGYKRVNSPFEIIGDKEKELQEFITKYRKNTNQPAQSVAECEHLWENINSHEKQKLKEISILAASEKSTRLACFHREIVNLKTTNSDKELIASTIYNLYKGISDEAFPILLSEAIHMPMATFIKSVE